MPPQKPVSDRPLRLAEMSQSSPWPFADKPNVAVFTTKGVVSGHDPILFVSHDAEDGAWQFHGAGETAEDDASIVALSTILRRDATIAELADLPFGWTARRESADAPWRRRAQ